MDTTQLERLREELRRKITGDVLFDKMTCLLYSTDASLYQIVPLGVVAPRTEGEIVQAVRTAAKYGVPILPRGGGTALAGQTVLRGLVVDCSKYLNRVLELNTNERWVRVQPGVILDNLNAHLQPHRLHFAPDVATSSRANVGGMMGNNSAGVHSIVYGKTVDHVLEQSVVLSTGEKLLLRNLTPTELAEKCSQQDREGKLYRDIREITDRNRDEIIRRFPKVMRRVGGYNLDLMLDGENFNLTKLTVGSEGTLVFVTEAKLNLEPLPDSTSVSVVHFDDLIRAVEAVPEILRHRPSAVEIMDHFGLELARSHPAIGPLCARFIQGHPQAILWVEFSGDSDQEVATAVAALEETLKRQKGVYACYHAPDQEAKDLVWGVRKNSLGILLGMKGDSKPLPFVEDAGIPVEKLPEYVSRVREFCQQKERQLALYAHASAGVIHIRPILNMKKQEDVIILREISERVFELVREYGGSWSGEHGDGLVRSYKNKEFFGEQLYEAFRQVKQAFDPAGLMNPGKIVEAQQIDENLRISPQYRAQFPPTHFQFRQEEGFDRAIEMCTGVGHCRKTLSGTMCPSYMATRDEEHSTRGRATALRMAISGKLGPDGLTDHRLYQVMDLCLECKMCKSECPSGVDMARLKSEFLAHYYDRHGRPWSKKLVAQTRMTAEWGSRAPGLVNLGLGNTLARWLLEKVAGIDRRRTLPTLAPHTFEHWFRRHRSLAQNGSDHPTVILFADTFINFYEPHIAVAATHLLESLDYRVVLAKPGCCGRPLISTGQLEQVKQKASSLVHSLAEYTRQNLPVIMLEPTCLSTVRDDYPDLLEPDCQKITDQVVGLEEFLAREEPYTRLRRRIGKGPGQVLFHGHCQQKALVGIQSSVQVLGALQETKCWAPETGCCGMAGPFGYEKEHYQLSRQIGELRLFPSINQASTETEIVASGFSCRAQIQHCTGRSARHLAEVMAEAVTD